MLTIGPVVSNIGTFVVTPLVLIINGFMYNHIADTIDRAEEDYNKLKAALDMPEWINECVDLYDFNEGK